jgi:hypothetical protein
LVCGNIIGSLQLTNPLSSVQVTGNPEAGPSYTNPFTTYVRDLKIEYEGYPLPSLTPPSDLRQDQLEKIYNAIEAGTFKFKKLTPARLIELEAEHVTLETTLTTEQLEAHPGIHRVTKRKMALKSFENLRAKKQARQEDAVRENINPVITTLPAWKEPNITEPSSLSFSTDNILMSNQTTNINNTVPDPLQVMQLAPGQHNSGVSAFPVLEMPLDYQLPSGYSDHIWDAATGLLDLSNSTQPPASTSNVFQGFTGGPDYGTSSLYNFTDMFQ